jgi:hypothetical protein
MQQYRVHLTSQNGGEASGARARGELPLSARQHQALVRQYRGYLPGPQWLPETPVFVWLTGPKGKLLPRLEVDAADAYELSLVARKDRPALKKLVAAAAAAVGFVVPMTSTAVHADVPETNGHGSAPPSIHGNGPAISDSGPPTAALSQAPRSPHRLHPLLDGYGDPVELAAFHSNSVVHANSVTAHTNNPMTPHTNTWTNHSNIPQWSIPHTNVVPGDFIF